MTAWPTPLLRIAVPAASFRNLPPRPGTHAWDRSENVFLQFESQGDIRGLGAIDLLAPQVPMSWEETAGSGGT